MFRQQTKNYLGEESKPQNTLNPKQLFDAELAKLSVA
jgi:hypothetical protein